jgi:uncharacterized protein
MRSYLAIVVAALLLSGCGKSVEKKAFPAVWLLRDADTTIYLAGTVHLLPNATNWANGPIVQAMADADALVTELSPDELGAAPAVAQHYLYNDRSVPPASRFDPKLQKAFAALQSAKLPRQPRMDNLDDWALALLMAQTVAAEAELSGENGMDNGLIAAFDDAGKQRLGLETAADQFSRFDAIPAAEQRFMLNRLMRNIANDTADDQLTSIVDAWSGGNVTALAEIIARDAALAPQTHRLLLVERNHRWADWITDRMKRPGTILVAVGAGHLAGQDSLLEQLADRDLNAKRLP